MKTATHTLVLATPRVDIPAGDIIPFVKNLIETKQTSINYFGGEEDPGIDYCDPQELERREVTTYITFHLEDETVNYSGISEAAVLKLIMDGLEYGVREVLIDKDIEIYFN